MPTLALDFLFHPRSVAVVGVSSNPSAGMGGGGNGFLRSIREMGFMSKHHCTTSCFGSDCASGCLYPVNPKATEIEGLHCYPSLREIPGAVDYVISSVPATAVPTLLEDAIAKGVKAIHFFTAGFSETGDEERAGLEQWMLERARAAGIRIVGPNCMGLYVPESGLSFMQGFPTKPGRTGLISQSGANAGEFVYSAAARGVRFAKVVSYGNALDLNECDFLEYMAEDPETDSIFAYIEGVRDGRRFVRALRDAAVRKPVVILKGGRTEAGSRATSSHTASLAGSIEVFDALCRQTGAIRVESMDALVDLATALTFLPPPGGPGIAVIGAGGGASVLAADAIAAAGLQVPPMPEDVQDELRRFTPEAGTSVRNPIDTTSIFAEEEFVRTVSLAARPEAIDTVIFHTTFIWGGRAPDETESRIESTVHGLVRARAAIAKPILVSVAAPLTGSASAVTARFVERCVAERLPVFAGIASAAGALAAMWQRSQRLTGPQTGRSPGT